MTQPDTTLPKVPAVRVYKAIMTQTGTSAPTAVVVQNTMGGSIVWSRSGVGVYEGTLTGAFTAGKTLGWTAKNAFGNQVAINKTSANVITIYTSDHNDNPLDVVLSNLPVIIEVHE